MMSDTSWGPSNTAEQANDTLRVASDPSTNHSPQAETLGVGAAKVLKLQNAGNWAVAAVGAT